MVYICPLRAILGSGLLRFAGMGREGQSLGWLGAGACAQGAGALAFCALILQSVTCAQLLPSFFCYDSWYVRESSGLCLFVLP